MPYCSSTPPLERLLGLLTDKPQPQLQGLYFDESIWSGHLYKKTILFSRNHGCETGNRLKKKLFNLNRPRGNAAQKKINVLHSYWFA